MKGTSFYITIGSVKTNITPDNPKLKQEVRNSFRLGRRSNFSLLVELLHEAPSRTKPQRAAMLSGAS